MIICGCDIYATVLEAARSQVSGNRHIGVNLLLGVHS
jgi:hypothetical protein